MSEAVFPLSDTPRAWLVYAGVLGVVALLFFGDLAALPFDVDDAFYLRDSAALSEDLSSLFSPSRFQGRPAVNLIFWAGRALWGEDPAPFHLLVVCFHALASLLLALAARRTGADLETAFLAGLLILVNVAHFRAIYWIAAMAYPLALALALAAVLCHQQFLKQQRPGWLAGTCLALLAGALAHPAASAIWAFCLFLAWRRDPRQALLKLLPLGAALAALILGMILFYPETPPVKATARFSGLSDLGWNLLWFLSRLLTTAHWLPLTLYRFSSWELAVGAVVLAGLALAAWSRRPLIAEWAIWTLATLLPFLTMSPAYLRDLPQAGPSRFIYLASAGASVLLAFGLRQGAARIAGRSRGLSRALSAVLLSGLFFSSFRALERAQAFSFYSTGRNALAFGVPDQTIQWLSRAVAGDSGIVPLGDAYSRLLIALLTTGADPEPFLSAARARVPRDETIAAFAAVLEAEQPDSSSQDRGLEKLALLREQARSRGQQQTFDSRLASIYTNIAAGRGARKDYEGTIRALRRALAHDPTRVFAVKKLAYTLFLAGHPREAEAEARRAVALDPENAAEMLFFLGDCHKTLGEMDKSAAAYQQALALVRPGDPGDYEKLAQYLAGEDPRGAIEVLEQASKGNPYEGRIYYYLGNLHYLEGDFARAVEEYRASLRLAPQSSKTWSNLGMALQALGRVEEAVQVYQQAIQIQPDQPVFYHNLGGLRLEQGDWPGAATAFRKALDLGYHNLETYLSLAEIYLETGKVEAALELCRQALATQPSSAAQFKLGLAYLRLGQTAQARVAYEEGIKQFGAGEGERIGAVDDLKDLIARGIQGAEAQRILDNYWKNRSGE